ncbi:MAG: protein dpnD [Proteobacteria bacterium]|nr:protein dpnD [Pseudomonadota bacterium]
MRSYSIEVIEVLSRVVNISAKDEDDAYFKVKKMYQQEKIVLDDSDYVDTEFKELKYE